jgi:hypothetical protein
MTENKAEYYVSKAPRPLRGLNYFRKHVQSWFTTLSAEGRCYSIGITIVIVAAAIAVFKRSESGVLIQMGLFVFALGLLPLIERLYEWAWRTLLGKLLIAALIALATNIAYGFGRQMVGGLVGTSPEPFSATVNIATILIAPVLFLMFLAIGGFFILLLAAYVGMFATLAFLPSMSPNKWPRACLWSCRFVAISIAVIGSWSLLNRSTNYTAWVERRAAGYLYTFDMYYDTKYATAKTEKVAFLPDGRILLGNPEPNSAGYAFKPRRVNGNEINQGER